MENRVWNSRVSAPNIPVPARPPWWWAWGGGWPVVISGWAPSSTASIPMNWTNRARIFSVVGMPGPNQQPWWPTPWLRGICPPSRIWLPMTWFRDIFQTVTSCWSKAWSVNSIKKCWDRIVEIWITVWYYMNIKKACVFVKLLRAVKKISSKK